MNRISHWIVACFLLAGATVGHAEEVVVFGDSLSDQGNAASGIGAFPPPFYLGSRVSNGPVAVEVFANLLGSPLSASRHLVGEYAGNNFAVAGARAGGSEPIDLKFQVGAYLLLNGGNVASDRIYIMMIGGNDVRDARGERGGAAVRLLRDAASEIDEQLRLLISLGARSIMVVNAPDIGIIPNPWKSRNFGVVALWRAARVDWPGISIVGWIATSVESSAIPL